MTSPCKGTWTSGFDEKRGDHPHAAQDIVAPFGEPWKAVRDGYAIWYVGVLMSKDRDTYNLYGHVMIDGPVFTFANYTLDVYGALCVLQCKNPDEVWVYCHMTPDRATAFFNARAFRQFYHKKANDEWMLAMWTDSCRVGEGDTIGYVGYAGKTLPTPYEAHLHIEGHPGSGWVPYEKRIRLEEAMRR